MWRRNKWILVAVLAATILLLAGIIGGVAYAQTGGTSPGNSGKTVLARVAAILGIDQKKVEDAFAQAQREICDEALNNRLKSLVEQGKITQQQADQYKQWQQSKPDMPVPQWGPRGNMGFRGGYPCFPGPAGRLSPPSTSTVPKSS